MTLVVTDEPPDRPEWIGETIRLVAEGNARWRDEVLARVARATDTELGAGTDDAWGVGQVAVHVLLIERGVASIALSLARGEPPGRTGQPRPASGGVSRDGITALARKAADATARLAAEFPAQPNMTAVGRHPYYGDLNAVGWLLTLSNHYQAHLQALDRGGTSAL